MKLSNIKVGYAEFEWEFEGHTYFGYVEVQPFVVKTDFEKDEIILTRRWVSYLVTSKGLTYPPPNHIGRLTGYKTRREALAAVQDYIYGGGSTNASTNMPTLRRKAIRVTPRTA